MTHWKAHDILSPQQYGCRINLGAVNAFTDFIYTSLYKLDYGGRPILGLVNSI